MFNGRDLKCKGYVNFIKWSLIEQENRPLQIRRGGFVQRRLDGDHLSMVSCGDLCEGGVI